MAEPAVPAAGDAPRPDRVRVEKATNGALAAALCLEALTVLFIPRAIAQSGPGLTTTRLVITLVLAGVLFVVAGLQRRPFGRAAGSGLQVAVFACGLLVGAMFFLGAVFALVWAYLLRLRGDLLDRAGPPAG